MVDLYDSLEDENVEDTYSPDSLDCQTKDFASKHPEHRKQLHLSRVKNVHLVLNRQHSEPSIILDENSSFKFQDTDNSLKTKKGENSIPLHVFNIQVLREKGLQLNRDGSFTKSPRSECEELPFVTREYRNLPIQRNKGYRTSARAPSVNEVKKEASGFREKPGNGMSMINIIRAGKRRMSTEGQFRSTGHSLSPLKNKTSKEYLADDNLTDTMKEVLLQKQNQTGFLPKTFNTSQRLRQVKRVMNLLDNSKLLKEAQAKASHQWERWPESDDLEEKLPEIAGRRNSNYYVHPIQKRSQARCNLLAEEPESNPKNNAKCLNSKVFKHQSEITIKTGKPRMSYWEQHQKQSGFNPLSLKPGHKKTPTDTNRSNYGDSVADLLSDVSSTIREQISDVDENEELFYRKVMDYESRGFHISERSEMSDNTKKTRNYITNPLKPRKEVTSNKEINSFGRRPSKSTSIEMPSKFFESGKNQKKFSHYCSGKSASPTLKNELVLKAKAYGYMANARNIFKLKMLPEGKLHESRFDSNAGAMKSSSRGCKNQQKSQRAGLIKEKSFPGSINLSARNKQPDQFARKSKSLCKTEKYKVVQKKPQVDNFY